MKDVTFSVDAYVTAVEALGSSEPRIWSDLETEPNWKRLEDLILKHPLRAPIPSKRLYVSDQAGAVRGPARGQGLAAGSRTEAVARTRADEIKIIQQKLRTKLKEVDKLREELAATEARAREETEERTRYPAGDAEILAP